MKVFLVRKRYAYDEKVLVVSVHNSPSGAEKRSEKEEEKESLCECWVEEVEVEE